MHNCDIIIFFMSKEEQIGWIVGVICFMSLVNALCEKCRASKSVFPFSSTENDNNQQNDIIKQPSVENIEINDAQFLHTSNIKSSDNDIKVSNRF